MAKKSRQTLILTFAIALNTFANNQNDAERAKNSAKGGFLGDLS